MNSNRLTKTVNGEVTKYTYNELNQLIAEDDIIYTYDDAGNLIAGSRNNILLFSYEYSSCNQMTRSLVYTVEGILTAEYEYNYLGDRISKVVDGTRTTYTLDYSSGLSQILEETTDGKTIFYVRGLELISREELTGTYFYIFDGGNTVRALVDEDGNVTDKYVFDSFGNKVSHEGDSSNSYGFQGEQLDEETELYYLRARYMNPSTGTFTSMDTYGGSLSDPTSLHKYLFANSNPVKYCDPTGNMTLAQEELAIGVLLMVNTITLVGLKSIGFINSKENKNCIFSVSLQKGFLGMTFVSILQSILLLEILYASQSRKLRKNMINAYKNGDRGGKKPPDYKNAAHHIVPILMARAQKARDVLIKFGIDLNDAVNGVFLPTVKNVSNACYHCALHTEEYIEHIESLLEKCTTVEEVYEVLMFIAEELLNGTCPH
ncbi:MAG: AHH domain-containing protein [Clostridia bacterium]|nr:AHH domain-containing protein [Clostridia bacterium]